MSRSPAGFLRGPVPHLIVQLLFDSHPQRQRWHVESLPLPLLSAVFRVVGVEVLRFRVFHRMAPAERVALMERLAVADWYAVNVVHGSCSSAVVTPRGSGVGLRLPLLPAI